MRMSVDRPHWLGDFNASEDGNYHNSSPYSSSSSSSSPSAVPVMPAWLYSVTSSLGPQVFGKDRARAVGGAINLAQRLSGGPLGTPHGILGLSGFAAGPLGRPLRIQRGSASAWGIPVEALKSTTAAEGAADPAVGGQAYSSSPVRGRHSSSSNPQGRRSSSKLNKSAAASAAARKQPLPLPSALVQWDGALGWESGGSDCNSSLAFFVPPVVQPEPRVVAAAQAPSRDMGPRVSRVVGSFQDVMFLVAALKHFIGPDTELDENLTSPIVGIYPSTSGSGGAGNEVDLGTTRRDLLPFASEQRVESSRSAAKPAKIRNANSNSEDHEEGDHDDENGGVVSEWTSPFRSDYSTKNGPLIKSTSSRALIPVLSDAGGAGEHKGGEKTDDDNDALNAASPDSPNRDRTMSALLRSVDHTQKHRQRSGSNDGDGSGADVLEDEKGEADDAHSTSSTIEEFDFDNDNDDGRKGNHPNVSGGLHVVTSEDGDESSDESSGSEGTESMMQSAASQAASLSVRIRIVGLECMLVDDW